MLTDMAPLTKVKPRRRWLQFSMRTVLVSVSVSCVALSLWVVPVERQRRAVVAIEALGGKVEYASDEATRNSFCVAHLRRWLPQVYFDEVEYVSLEGTQVRDAELIQLRALRALKRLNLDKTQIADAGLDHLKGLTGLQSLSLTKTQVTDAGLAQLKALTGLKQLLLNQTHVTDTGLAHLEGLTGLRTLILNRTQVTDAGLNYLNGLTSLKRLSLYATEVTEAGVARLQRALPRCFPRITKR